MRRMISIFFKVKKNMHVSPVVSNLQIGVAEEGEGSTFKIRGTLGTTGRKWIIQANFTVNLHEEGLRAKSQDVKERKKCSVHYIRYFHLSQPLQF